MQNPDIDPLTQSLFQLIKRLPHLRMEIRPIPGLTKSEHELLVVLRINTSQEKKLLTASELAGLLQITPAGGTHLIKPLETAGYLTRVADSGDRRKTLLGLTPKGIAASDALLAEINRQIVDLIAYLGPEDSRNFIRLLGKAFDFITPGLLPVNDGKQSG